MLARVQSIFNALTMGGKGGFYAVRTGRKTGVFRTWKECESYVKGFPGARYKKFSTEDEAKSFVSGLKSSGSLTSAVAAPSQESRKRTFHEVCGNNQFDNARSLNSKGSKFSKPYRNSGIGSSWTSSSISSLSNDDSSSGDRPVVYTDGGCTKNGKKGARAGIGVYWGPKNTRNVSERLEGEQTNQRAEIMAAVKAIETAKEMGYKTLEIRTDSNYTIKGATDWCKRWKKNGWKTVNGTEVKNKVEFQKLTKLCDEIDVKWTHVRGHQGNIGNEAADELAREGAMK